ncbi:MAG: transposase [Candidatus Nealsonbacteria bacterium]|nr:transposase [Candidatus Nealsonbacteria bacterium]
MPPVTSKTTCAIGVGVDTARYGHHATFLQEDRQMATKPLEFLESHSGYESLRDVLGKLAKKQTDVHFHIRVDAAGQYATNLLAFLHRLPWPKTISVGDPVRNKQYCQVHFPKRKADAVESHACARFAIVERPDSSSAVTPEMLALREVTSRLEFQVKQSTREVNRLHNLLGRVFPELATLQNDFKAGWVLRLLDKYPTAQRIAKVQLRSLIAIPYLGEEKARLIHQAAKESVAAEQGVVVEELVRQSVRGLSQSLAAEKQLETLLLKAFGVLGDERAKQIATIPGIGQRTAAALVAKILSIDRFPTADHLTSYFGVFPEESSSGVDKFGRPRPQGTMRMSRKGNDLVRKYLWMASFVAIRCNPQVKTLYARLRARGRRGDVALGHCMRKLLHQVFGIWTSGRPYDPDYHKADNRAPFDAAGESDVTEKSIHEQEEAAGRKAGISPPRKAVTATTSTVASVKETVKTTRNGTSGVATNGGGSIDFAYLRSQISMEQVLRQLGYFGRLRGNGNQRRGPCPVHGARRDRGRSFSVHLGKNVFQCFHPPCGAVGNVLDLWCTIHQLTSYEGAIHLANTFGLKLRLGQPEKRNP